MKKTNDTFSKFKNLELQNKEEVKGGLRASSNYWSGGTGGTGWIDWGDIDIRTDFGQVIVKHKNGKIGMNSLG